MRKILFIISILTSSICSGQETCQSEFLTKDKQQHFIGSISVSGFSYLIISTHPKFKNWTRFQCRTAAFLTSTAVGLVWESKGVFSWYDLGANLIGNITFQGVITIPIHIGNIDYRKEKRIAKRKNKIIKFNLKAEDYGF